MPEGRIWFSNNDFADVRKLLHDVVNLQLYGLSNNSNLGRRVCVHDHMLHSTGLTEAQVQHLRPVPLSTTQFYKTYDHVCVCVCVCVCMCVCFKWPNI